MQSNKKVSVTQLVTQLFKRKVALVVQTQRVTQLRTKIWKAVMRLCFLTFISIIFMWQPYSFSRAINPDDIYKATHERDINGQQRYHIRNIFYKRYCGDCFRGQMSAQWREYCDMHRMAKFQIQKVSTIGNDDRDFMTDRADVRRYNGAGKITIGDYSYASGWITGNNCDVLITAGHVVVNTGTVNEPKCEPEAEGTIYFHPGVKYPSLEKVALENKDIVSPYIRTGCKRGVNDWAVAKFDKPVVKCCSQIPIKYGRLKYEENIDQRLVNPAVHSDAPKILMISKTSEIKKKLDIGKGHFFNTSPSLFITDTDSKHASSGSILFHENERDVEAWGLLITGQDIDEEFGEPPLGSAGEEFNAIINNTIVRSFSDDFGKAVEAALAGSEKRFQKRQKVDNCSSETI